MKDVGRHNIMCPIHYSFLRFKRPLKKSEQSWIKQNYSNVACSCYAKFRRSTDLTQTQQVDRQRQKTVGLRIREDLLKTAETETFHTIRSQFLRIFRSKQANFSRKYRQFVLSISIYIFSQSSFYGFISVSIILTILQQKVVLNC